MDMRKTIGEELRKVEEQYHVRILHAVESGSRSWGFASPDSDYDVRFVYLRPATDYLRLDEPRDVIEWKNDGVLDINGWDLKKALKQFARGNATLFEWSFSPVIYETTPEWAEVQRAALGFFSAKTAAYHYYGTAMSTWTTHLLGETVRYKKYFYALRPLLAARWIEEYHQVPPVLFDRLLEMNMEDDLRAAIDDLVERKKRTTEGEQHPQIPAIRDFIRDELPRQKMICDAMPEDRNPDLTSLDQCFLRIIGLEHVLSAD